MTSVRRQCCRCATGARENLGAGARAGSPQRSETRWATPLRSPDLPRPLSRCRWDGAGGTGRPVAPSGFLARQPSKLRTQESQTWAHATCNRRSRTSPGHVSVKRTTGPCPGLVCHQPSSGFTRRHETVTEPGPGTGRLTRPATPSSGYLKEARRPVAATSPSDLEAYVALFIALLMACAVALIVHEVVRPTGTPGETIDSIVTSLRHAGAAAICFTVVTAAVIQGTRLAARRARQWLFKSSEEQDWTPEVRQGPVRRQPWPLRDRYRQ